MRSDPPRLVDCAGEPAALREDLRVARETPPLAYDASAGLTRLEAAVRQGRPADPSAAARPKPAPAPRPVAMLQGSSWSWIAGAVAAAGAVVAGFLAFEGGALPSEPTPVPPSTERRPAEGRSSEAATEAPATEAPATRVPATEAPAMEAPAMEAPAMEAPAMEARATEAAAAEARAPETPSSEAPTTPGPPAGTPPAWSEEIAQLARIRHLLERDPAAALALAERGQRDFPEGMFHEEREALAVFATDRLGRPEAALRRGQRFLRRYPDSPFAPRVRGIVDRTSLRHEGSERVRP